MLCLSFQAKSESSAARAPTPTFQLPARSLMSSHCGSTVKVSLQVEVVVLDALQEAYSSFGMKTPSAVS